MSQHSIDAINRFADVLDNQDRAFEVRSKWSSEQCSDQGEISSDDATSRAPGSQYSSVSRNTARILLIDERSLE
jgi:hypothetical protein